jgi:hypothetical protein
MAKAQQKSRIERAKVRVRGGSDRERAIYVGVRKALAPRMTLTRAQAARAGDPAELEIPADKGYLILPPGALPEAAEVVADATTRFEESGGAEGIKRDRKRKQFMIPIVGQTDLTRESPIVRLALRDDVLAAASAYLGSAPLLSSANVYVSKSSERELMSSQLFHCDADDTKQVKIFVLCSEVTEANGPLKILDAADSALLRGKLGYRYRDRVTDEEARAAIGERPLVSLTGAPGTVCFVDTSRCFHYGSRVEGEAAPRLAAMAQFLTPHSFMLPRDVRSEAPFRRLAGADERRLQTLALGA